MASKCASKTLFVGNLHASLEENDLLEIFRPYGRIIECCKRWCHYGFIQFATEDEAKLAFTNLNGSKVRGRPMRIEFQRKKLRNIQALLEAEAESKTHLLQTKNSDLNYFNLNNENFNPINSYVITSVDQIKDEDEDLTDSAEIEKCWLKVFDEILVEDNKKENNILKTITNLDKKNSNSSKSDIKLLENVCFNSISSCSSPLSQKDDLSSSSIRLFRSINSSNSIYVQPSDIIIPLSEGDYNEYKLFPSEKNDSIVPSSEANTLNIMNNILSNLGLFEKKSDFYNANEDELELYSPPISSVSSDTSCSNSSSLISSPSSNSPIHKFFLK